MDPDTRTIPRWKRLIGAAAALHLLILSVGPHLVLAATTAVHQQQQEQAQQEEMTIGVLGLEVNNVDEGEARAIAERLRLYLGRQPIFRIIERSRMEDLMEEQGFQLSGTCDTDECVVEVGRILGASKMVAGSVSKVGNLYTLQVRMIDIETSRIDAQAFRDVLGIEQVLMEATEAVAVDLAQTVLQARGVPVEQVQPREEQPVREQEEVQQPVTPVTEEPAQVEAQPRRRGLGYWWFFIIGIVGGGAYALTRGGEEENGGPTVPAIPMPPGRPDPPR